VGLNVGAFASDLRLTERDVAISQRATTAVFEVRALERLTLGVAAGAIFGGRLEIEGTRHDVKPGWIAAVSSSYRLLDGEGLAPFVLVGFSFGMSRAATTEITEDGNPTPRVALTTADARLSLVVGKTFFDVVAPYIVGRAFGGPVWWSFRGEDLRGGDVHHYQVGAGISARAVAGLDVYVEGAPIGERRISGGLGWAF
jgi:hypothetical protein